MPNISSRALQMPASPIRKLVPFATAAKERGTYVYHLNIGQPDIPSIPSALQALRDFNLPVLEYSMSEGMPQYRAALTKYYHSLGITDVGPDHFIVTNGGSEALSFAIGVLCDQDDEILTPDPFYANYNGFAAAYGVKINAVSSYLEDAFALPGIQEIRDSITPKTKAILICNPGNPTGYVYTREELQALANLAIEKNIAIISDEVYREYVYDGASHTSMLSFTGLDEHVIVIDSESKRYSLCGARVGFLVSRSASYLSAAMKFAQARLSPVVLGQMIATKAHENDGEYLRNVREEYQKRRNVLVNALNAIPGVICPTPKGAFYCTVQLPVEDSEDFSIFLLNEFSYEGETVMLAPAGGFYNDPEKGKHQVRIAYVLEEKALLRSAELLALALQQYKNKNAK